MIKYRLSSAKYTFVSDEFWDCLFTGLLLVTCIYAGYVHLIKLHLPFHPSHLIAPEHEHFVVLRLALFISVLVQFKEFNRILLGLHVQPVQLLVGGFFLVIVLGTVVLSLPQAGTSKIPFIDALFTATSATCVTGLITLQPGTDFTLFGQIVIVILMQIGGLGIMTLSAFIALLLRGGLGIEGRRIMTETIEFKASHQLTHLLKQIIKFTFIVESAGAVIFIWRFLAQGYGFYNAFYHGVFHAISGFCNAGMSLFPENILLYQKDPYFLLTMAMLIILGGIGFLVVLDVKHLVLSKQHPKIALSVQTKIVLSITGVLIVGGTLLILFTEYFGQLNHLPLKFKVLNAFFQAVTPRTAGFNTLDVGTLSHATLLMLMILMFIGGASGSTAGGIKVNTVGVLFGLLRAVIRNKPHVMMFERTIPTSTIHKAIALTFLSVLIQFFAALLIIIHDQFPLLPTMFETISAFNTVGLSMGITASLSSFSKMVITLLMFIGRVGPIAFVVALAQRDVEESYVEYPEEYIVVG